MFLQILLSLTFVCSNVQAQERTITSSSHLSAGSEVFILQRVPLSEGRHALYGEVTLGASRGRKLWLLYDANNPTAKIFTSELKDMLAQPTLRIEEAYYLFATEEQRDISEEIWLVNILAKMPAPREDIVNSAHRYQDLEIALIAIG